MGLKGYRLWVMGQLDSNVQSPTTLMLNATLPPAALPPPAPPPPLCSAAGCI
jgi:hypothetical protein